MTTKHVLIVHHLLSARRYYQDIVASAGHTSQLASNDVDGLESALNDSFHLILIDAELGNTNGFLLNQNIRRSDGMAATPILLLSQTVHCAEKDRAYQAGANMVAQAPVQQREMLGHVKLLMGDGF